MGNKKTLHFKANSDGEQSCSSSSSEPEAKLQKTNSKKIKVPIVTQSDDSHEI